MRVENIPTSGRITSVGEVQTNLVGMRSGAPHKASKKNKAELRALQQQQDDLRNVSKAIVVKQQEEKKAHVGEAQNQNKRASGKREQTNGLSHNEKVRNIVVSGRGREWDSEQKEDRKRHARKMQSNGHVCCATRVCITQHQIPRNEEVSNVDEEVLQTMVRDDVQDGEGPIKKKRFVFKDHNDTCPCVAAASNTGLLASRRVDHRR